MISVTCHLSYSLVISISVTCQVSVPCPLSCQFPVDDFSFSQKTVTEDCDTQGLHLRTSKAQKNPLDRRQLAEKKTVRCSPKPAQENGSSSKKQKTT